MPSVEQVAGSLPCVFKERSQTCLLLLMVVIEVLTKRPTCTNAVINMEPVQAP